MEKNKSILIEIKEKFYCVFCGEKIDTQIDYKCMCNDAIKYRAIDHQIETLNFSRPQPKYEQRKMDELVRITSCPSSNETFGNKDDLGDYEIFLNNQDDKNNIHLCKK